MRSAVTLGTRKIEWDFVVTEIGEDKGIIGNDFVMAHRLTVRPHEGGSLPPRGNQPGDGGAGRATEVCCSLNSGGPNHHRRGCRHQGYAATDPGPLDSEPGGGGGVDHELVWNGHAIDRTRLVGTVPGMRESGNKSGM